MQVGVWLRTFALDDKVHILLILLMLDFILGVTAALRVGTFRLSYVADFMRNDVLFKLLPYFALYAASLVAGGVDIVLPGLDFGFVAGAAFITVTAAFVGSILASLKTLGLLRAAPNEIAGAENLAPPKS